MLTDARTSNDASSTGSFMSDSQFANYLADLRVNRAARLNGSRPPPPSRYTSKREPPTYTQDASTGTASAGFQGNNGSFAGRPLVPGPLKIQRSHTSPPNLLDPQHQEPLERARSPSPTYMENGARWIDRQEAHSLRVALEDMDAQEEQHVHEAAQDEASKLVWEHRNPGLAKKPESAYKNPDLGQRDYKAHLRKGSYERSHNQDSLGSVHKKASSVDLKPKSSFAPSPLVDAMPKVGDQSGTEPVIQASAEAPKSGPGSDRLGSVPANEPRRQKSYQGLVSAVAKDIANAKRRVSSGSKRKASSDKTRFPNPDDKIYEEPEEITHEVVVEDEVPTLAPAPTPAPAEIPAPADIPAHVRRNPFARVKFAQEKLSRTKTEPVEIGKRFNPIEIHKNPPTQSRKPWYLANKPSVSALKEPSTQDVIREDEEPVPATKDGLEIRSDDIRAATSMKRKDRSTNLPQPTAVSDSPGRPIVSFQSDWKPTEIVMEEVHTSAEAPKAPTVNGIDTEPRSKQTRPARSEDPLPTSTDTEPQPERKTHQYKGHQSKRSITAAEYLSAASSKPTVNMGPLPAVAIPSISVPDEPESPSRTLAEEPILPTVVMPESPTRALPDHPTQDSTMRSSKYTPPMASNPYFPPMVPAAPTISVEEPRPLPNVNASSPVRRPLPQPKQGPVAPLASARPSPHHANTAPVPGARAPHYTPSTRGKSTALCAQCALPISGRILSAAGERFHPECFRCHLCSTNLECVAFYPEPDQKHYERIARIQQRNQGLEVSLPEGWTHEDAQRLEEEDGDESLRFFCHLDYHELFSPRCRSCKTPIEGEVVVACGAEWHVGHFFCAQCGDPFDSSTPFVEREGYAWCIGCHTNRYSPKCKKCRKPITDVVVNALGSEWHGDCFSCMECGGHFDDDNDITESKKYADRSFAATPFRKRLQRDHDQDPLNSPAQSVSTNPTGERSRKYYTPALPSTDFGVLSDLTGRLLDTQGSISNSTDTYYTASWGSPYQYTPSQTTQDSRDRSRTFDLASRYLANDSPARGLSFDLDHLIPSRVPLQRLGSPELPPRGHSAIAFGERLGRGQESTRRLKRSHTADWIEHHADSGNWSSDNSNAETSDAEGLLTPVATSKHKLAGKGSRFLGAPTSPTPGTRSRSISRSGARDATASFVKGHKSRDDNKTVLPDDFQTGLPVSRTAESGDMLATRWAATPDKEKHMHMRTEEKTKEAGPRKLKQPLEMRPSLFPRQKKKLSWRGKTCMIALPNGVPQDFGGNEPLSVADVQARLLQWEEAGWDTNGFNMEDTHSNDGAAQGRPQYPDPSDSLQHMTNKDFRVSVPDPKAWRTYVDWLTEQKLRALGVSTGPDDDVTPVTARQNSQHQMPRSFSPSINAPFVNAQGFPMSQRSTPGLSNFSTGPHSRTMSVVSPMPTGLHSRTMSIASPFPTAVESRGHTHRHSVFGTPFGMQQNQALNPALRSFSPSQQASLNGVARGASPAFDRLKQNISPVATPGSPFDMQQYRPSPLQPDGNWTPPAHMRHQSLASSFSPQPVAARMTPSQPSLAEVPEDEEDLIDDYFSQKPASRNGPPAEIAVPTPRGHRHNISETLENDVRGTEEHKHHAGPLNYQALAPMSMPMMHHQPAPVQDSFTFGHGYGQRQSVSFNAMNGLAPQYQPQFMNYQAPQAPHQASQPSQRKGHMPTQSVFRAGAPEFHFNPNTASQQSFQPVQKPNLPSVAIPAIEAQTNGHAHQVPSGDVKVTTSTLNPAGFGNGSLQTGNFDFSAASFKPSVSAVQPIPAAKPATTQKSIFGDVQISDEEKTRRRSKAIPIVRPVSSTKEEGTMEKKEEDEAEDEHGRVLQSEDRQKRAFQRQDDGDSVPMFAQRPESPVVSSPTVPIPLHLPEEIKDNRTVATDAQDFPAPVADTLETRSVLNGQQSPSRKRQATAGGSGPTADSAPSGDIDTQVSVPVERSHQRNLSSLSALAKPFAPGNFGAADHTSGPSFSSLDDREMPLEMSKPDLSPARVFSRDVAAQQDAETSLTDPLKQSPGSKPSPYHLAESTFEPSFDEIDAVMRQLNDEEDRQAAEPENEVDQTLTPRSATPTGSSPRSEAPSPGSTKILQSIEQPLPPTSSLAENFGIASPNVRRLNRSSIAPASDWSDDFPPVEDGKIHTRGSFFDDHVDELIGNALEAHLRPLQQMLKSVKRSVAAASNDRRPRTSSGIDSDADDEDDIADSKLLPRPVSRGKEKKLEAMKAVVLDALSTHAAASGLHARNVEVEDAVTGISAVIAGLAKKSLDADDIRIVVEEALHNHGKALVLHVPTEVSSLDSRRELHDLRDHFDEALGRERHQHEDTKEREIETRRQLRLAEEELGLLRATVSDKDHMIRARERENVELRKRLDDDIDARSSLEKQVSDFEAETAAMASTLDEYRASSNKWREEIDNAEADKAALSDTIKDLRNEIADGLNVRDNMRHKLDKIHSGMATATQQLASEKAVWQNRHQESQKRHAVLQSRLEAESQLRNGVEIEIQHLREQLLEGTAAKASLEQSLGTNVMLEDAILALKDEVTDLQTANSRIAREIQDARENSRIDVQRANLMMQAGIETANSQAEAVQASLESKLAIANNELDNMRHLLNATKARHDVLVQEEADLRRDTLLRVNEASSAALDGLRTRHAEDVEHVKIQRDRAVAEAQQDKLRAESFWHERLSLSEAKNGHLSERISHLEERLTIAKTAAQAAASAAQIAKIVPESSFTSKEPDRISPQALRESILVLQEQLQERETHIERLQSRLADMDTTAPSKLKERDIEITWLRELLANRSDELTELITTLSHEDYDRDTVRDAAIRIRATLQMEQAEKERLINAGYSIPAQALANITNFASPKAVQLAAAIGNWRSKATGSGSAGTPSGPRSPAVPRVRDSREPTQTPSKRPPSAQSFLSGLMTPPASGLRRTPSPGSGSARSATVTPGSRGVAQGPQRNTSSRRPGSKTGLSNAGVGAEFDPPTPDDTPFSLRTQSFDRDAVLGGAELDADGDEVDDERSPHRNRFVNLAEELEPIG